MFAKLIKFTLKKYFSKNLGKISKNWKKCVSKFSRQQIWQKLHRNWKKMRLKFFDIKNLTKISQNWKKKILLGVFSSQTFTQTGLYPYGFESISQHVTSKYNQCSKCREGRTLHSTLTRTQKAHSQKPLPKCNFTKNSRDTFVNIRWVPARYHMKQWRSHFGKWLACNLWAFYFSNCTRFFTLEHAL
jgi:hypothetical protein